MSASEGIPVPCGRVHPDRGDRVVCELPDGHEGSHKGHDLDVAAGDERYWIWTDDREPDSR